MKVASKVAACGLNRYFSYVDIYCFSKYVLTLALNHFLPPPGGRQGKMPVTALEAFDLETKSWTRYPCIPSRRAFSCCATNERSLFSLGGLQQPGPHNFYSRPHFVSTMEEYDLDQGKWLPTYTVGPHSAQIRHCGKNRRV